MRRDTFHAFDQDVRRNACFIRSNQRITVACVFVFLVLGIRLNLKTNHVSARDRFTGNGCQTQVHQLKYRTARRLVTQRHVSQQVCVLNSAGHEVKNGCITANQLLQVRLLFNVTNFDWVFTTDKQFDYAVALAVVRNVVFSRKKFLHHSAGERMRLSRKPNQPLVVCVVFSPCLVKQILEAGSVINSTVSAIQFSLCDLAVKT